MTPEAAESGTRSKGAIAVVALIGLVCAWQVVARTYATYLAPTDPGLALRLNANESAAMITLAKRALRTRADAGDPSTPKVNLAEPKGRLPTIAEIAADATKSIPKTAPPVTPEKLEAAKQYATNALRLDPLNARALSLLGEVALNGGNEAKATEYMLAAQRLTPREWPAVLWLMQTSTDKGDHGKAMSYADTLLRSRSEMTRVVVPLLARAAETKASSQPLKDMLATNPPWRERFFSTVSNSITDARTPLELLQFLKETSHPPVTAELRPYLDFLMSRKHYDTAYYTWLQFLPPEQLASTGTVFNGSFETKPTGLPFDWRMTPGAGFSAAIEARAENDPSKALVISFSQGRAAFQPVMQSLLLSPGSYTFEVKHKGKINSTRGLVWRIVCQNKPQPPAGESAPANGIVKDWSPLTFTFQVPDDCPVQTLKLDLDARSASEQFISGTIWFDDVVVKPDRGAPTAAAASPTP